MDLSLQRAALQDISAPQPDSGWSREITLVRSAVAVPPTESRYRPVCGVWGEGRDVPTAAVWREDMRLTQPLTGRPEPIAHLPGRHLWGGVFFGHFGLFIVDTISRLWAAAASDAESIVFVPKHPGMAGLDVLHTRLLALLDIRLPVRLLDAPTRIDELLVPGQGFGLGAISGGTPEFHAMLGALAKNLPERPAERLYISRTRYWKKGGVLNEAALERNLVAQGYRAIHPQDLPIEEQLALYRAASHVVGIDSSAFHVFGFVARPGQKACLILRRNAPDHLAIARQMASALGTPPSVINALDADWVQDGKKRPNHMSWGELNHARLAQRLAEEGFIASAASWTMPDEAAPAEALAFAEMAARARLTRRPASGATP